MPDRAPVAYIRRSKVEAASPGDVSRDTQTNAIRALAGADADRLIVLEDWGVSGRGKSRHKRTAFGHMLELIGQDAVSTVYAYNLSRLGRSVRDVLELAYLCREHGTAIRLSDGNNVDASNATGIMTLTILGAVDEWQAEVQAERTTAVLAAWRETHPDERLGRKSYGDDPAHPEEAEGLALILATFDRVGSFRGTAEHLTRLGVPTRLGRGGWDTRTVSRIIRRARPEMEHAPIRQGRSARVRHMFSGLLRCACGNTLTSMPRGASVAYYCKRAHLDSTHPRPYVVAEAKVLRWAMDALEAETALVIERDNVPDAAALQARLDVLDSKRDRIVDMYADGTLTKVQRDQRLGRLAADRATVAGMLSVGGAATFYNRGVDWTLPAAEVNDLILKRWTAIQLNGGMQPKYAVDNPAWSTD